ncbi:MAG: ribbon-helix-helix protein, CopG family [Beijerinckiaceae bacterium]
MPPSTPSPTISLRLPTEARERLDRVARRTRRSRSFLMQEALSRHLDAIEREQQSEDPKLRLERLMKFAGVGKALGQARTVEDIDAHIRWLRGDDTSS